MGIMRRMVHNTVGTAGLAYQKYRTCDRKRVYPSEEAGWKDVRNIQRSGNDKYPDFELRPYQCAYCHQIHIGHSNRPRSTEERLRMESGFRTATA